MSNLREMESEAFSKWFSSQKTYSSLSAMERALNITKGYLHLIKDGSRRAADPELRQKLKEATRLKEFEPLKNTSETSVARVMNPKETLAYAPDIQQERRVPEDLPTLLESAIKKLGLTLDACSKKYGIKVDSLKKYKSGTRKPASEESIAAVLNILNDAQQIASEEKPRANVKILEQPTDTRILIKEVKGLREKVDQIDTKLAEARIYQEMARRPTSTNAEDRARTVMRLLLSLSRELEFFKSCTEDERKIFKRIVPGQDVGYITTLLRALYDEDKFQRWLLFSTYTMKGKENGE